ncbi:MAG: DUF4178 domain-containing protein [Chloroflexota bacterium]|nr:DUF4178 domain-containing protein [Chloroflexota bacterium]
MDTIQQRILEIALQIPDYVGYQEKERRRDVNENMRRQLALKYGEQRTYLSRLQRQAPLDQIVALENLDQKLLRLIARLQTATPGYAGWFDSAQIGESDLDQITQFDASLADGVNQIKARLEAVARAMKSKTGIEDAVAAAAETLDALNTLYDQREQFVSIGKKPSPLTLPRTAPTSPLDALAAKKAPPQEFLALASLKVNDAVSIGTVDYLVTGKATYTISSGSFWAFLLKDGGKQLWLRVGPGGEIATCQEVKISVPSPLPDSIKRENQMYTRGDAGSASVTVEGAGGVKRGSVDYARYTADDGARLWVEDFHSETRAMIGQTIDARELTVYQR